MFDMNKQLLNENQIDYFANIRPQNCRSTVFLLLRSRVERFSHMGGREWSRGLSH